MNDLKEPRQGGGGLQGADNGDGVGTAGSWEVVLKNGNVFLEVTFSSTGEVSGVSPRDPAVSSLGACKPAGSYLIRSVPGDGLRRQRNPVDG